MIKDLIGSLCVPKDGYYNQVTTLINGDVPSDTTTVVYNSDAVALSSLSGASGWIEALHAGYFNGSSYIQVPSNAAFAFPNGTDFTIEMWVNLQSFANNRLYETITSGGAELLFTNGIPSFGRYGVAQTVSSSTTLATNKWYHIAVTRSGTNTRIFVDGSQTGINSADTNSYAQATLNIGADGIPTYYTTGYISNLRVVKGQALYTSNFTPPTSRLTTSSNGDATPSVAPTPENVSLLALQGDNILTDNSPTPKTITAVGTPVALNAVSPRYSRKMHGAQNDLFSNKAVALSSLSGATESLYAGVFDGSSSSYLTFPTKDEANKALKSSSPWTFEAWIYLRDYNKSTILTTLIGDPVGHFVYSLQTTSTGYLLHPRLHWGYSASEVRATTNPVPLNTWTHVVLQQNNDSGSIDLFIGGQKATVYNSVYGGYLTMTLEGTVNSPIPRIGMNFDGYISSVRFTKQALYTSNFTPPTSRLSTSSNGGATPSTAPIPSNVSLLALQTASMYDDNSFSPKTISRGGDATMTQHQHADQTGKIALGSISPWSNSDGYWSGYFNGSSYLDITSNPLFAFPNGTDFTIECWINFSTFANNRFYSTSNLGAILYFVNGVPTFGTYDGVTILTSSITLQNNTWYHIAVARSGTTSRMFVNGVQASINTNDTTSYSQGNLRIGGDFQPVTTTGYASNLRVVKGQALYTGPFTPSTIPLTVSSNGNASGSTTIPAASAISLLTLQSNKFVDNSSTPKTITATGTPRTQTYNPFKQFRMQKTSFSSGRFDGASYLTAPASTAYALSGDFTIECWVNTNVISSDTVTRHLISMGTGTDSVNLLKIGLWNSAGAASNSLSLWSTALVLAGSIVVADGGWHHIAVTRSGTSLRLYVDGVQSGSTTTTSQSFNAGATTNIQIGRQNGAETGRFNGYISNLRIVNGTAIYTGPFTPPVAPVQISGAASAASYSTLTNVNTTFPASACAMLLDFDDAGVYDATGNTAVATYSQARSSDVQSKWNNKQSLYFNGSSYITYTPTPNFGTDPFTVEAWVWPVNAAGFWTVIDNRPGAGWILGQGATAGRLAWYNGTSWLQASTQVTTSSAWNHVMYTRSAGIGRLYCNGTFVVSASDTVNYNNPSVTTGFIGSFYDFNAGEFMNGYIDDLRITTGVARTSAYTYVVPPRPAPIR